VLKLKSRSSWLDKARQRIANAFEPDSVDGYTLEGSDLPWREWLEENFPDIAKSEPAHRHVLVWEWISRLVPGIKPPSFIAIWPRGGAKSSTVELGVAYVGARLTRRFALYICETQDQADEHVGNIAKLFEEMGVDRAVGKYGNSKGWKRDQLRTANGFNVTGIGIKTAARGIRLDKYRPDLIIIDDVDGKEDTKKTTLKKIRTLTQSLLPAGSSDAAVIFVQNKIQKDGIAAQLSDGRADFLTDREPISEEPAVRDLVVERRQREDGTWFWKIVKGIATWAGQSLEICEKQIAQWGYTAFLQEAQHDVDIAEGGLWDMERDIKPFRVFFDSLADFGKNGLPRLKKIVVAVDPSGGADGDEVGIVVAGVGKIGKADHGYVLESHALQCSPEEWAETALDLYDAYQADEIVVEVNFGGEMAEATFKAAGLAKNRRVPPITMVQVSRGKLIRAKPVQLLYDKGQVHHCEEAGVEAGMTHRTLEHQMCKWREGMDSPGALDAAVIALSRCFDLAKMVKEVKRATAIAATRLVGTVSRSGSNSSGGSISRPASSSSSGGSGAKRRSGGGGLWGSAGRK
jgi:hypothetical protein